MSRFQSTIIIRTIITSIAWYIFAYTLLNFGFLGSLPGALSIFLIGLWIGWKQDSIGFLAIIMSCISLLQYIFSAIPIYNYNPTLDTFLASKVPFIRCLSDESPQSFTLNDTTVITQQFCNRGTFPIHPGQTIQRSTPGNFIIGFGDGTSTFIVGPAKGTLQRAGSGLQISLTQGSQIVFTSTSGGSAGHSLQYTIKDQFAQEKKDYLQKNFPRVREQAPLLTKLSILKMRTIGLFDWTYNDKITHLQYYLTETGQQ